MLGRGTSKLKLEDLRHLLEGNTLRFLFIKGRVWPSLNGLCKCFPLYFESVIASAFYEKLIFWTQHMTSFQLVLLRGVFPKYIMEHSKAMAGFRLFVTMIRTKDCQWEKMAVTSLHHIGGGKTKVLHQPWDGVFCPLDRPRFPSCRAYCLRSLHFSEQNSWESNLASQHAVETVESLTAGSLLCVFCVKIA